MRTLAHAILLLSLLGGFGLAACEKVPEPTGGASPAVTKEPEAPEPKDIVVEDTVEGTGPVARDGDKVWVHYTGRLAKNNKEFDSSVGKKPFDLVIGESAVIQGWHKGIPGMKVGGKRKLTIPSKLGYGKDGSPPKIPPNATLIFDIELLSIGSEPGAAADAGAGDAGAKDAGSKGDAKDKGGDKKK